jgi:phage shock protein PspC (stress-responsive transcriptional regulator)
MEKTININLGGTLFQIEEEAYKILRNYLQDINYRFKNMQGGLETIEDIESRIGEIFNSQKGTGGIISKENVEAMISIIGKPEDFDQIDSEPEPARGINTNQRKRLYRNPDDSIIGGVCSGLGAYLNTDPVLFRILFAISGLFFGTGFLVYIVLWIAIPPAKTDSQKREMYGRNYNSARTNYKQADGYNASQSSGYYSSSAIGNAFNEVFRAIGRVGFIILRIFLIIFGVVFVITGFIAILSFVMIFVFKFPNAFTTHGVDMSLSYFPDFLNYIVSPSVAPWIMALSSIAFVLPMAALIYWGVKMIFWFKARDGVVSLACLVLWVLSITALSVLLLNEGVSFAESAKTTSMQLFSPSNDTLYVVAGKKVADLKFDKEFALPDEEYDVLINDDKKELYIRPCFSVKSSDEGVRKAEVRKRSAGRTRADAFKKIEELNYNFSVNGDTLLLDEYFTFPSGRKWSADNIGINLKLPIGTIIKFDAASYNLLHSNSYLNDEDDYDTSTARSDYKIMILTDEGLQIADKHQVKQK